MDFLSFVRFSYTLARYNKYNRISKRGGALARKNRWLESLQNTLRLLGLVCSLRAIGNARDADCSRAEGLILLAKRSGPLTAPRDIKRRKIEERFKSSKELAQVRYFRLSFNTLSSGVSYVL